ncbi:MAG: class I SAM-dependent methyltransferase [Treponemataceae bacterium]|nr:class I SAM-dependent methyltransferase [Treponemataceae bacterium]
MDFLHNIIEYYDELYPVTEDQKKLYKDLTKDLVPAKILRIGCATGGFEHWLAKEGHDVTGIETSKEMLETANRRRRMPNTAIRFFQMSTIEMTRFLGKGFYNVISCLSDRIIFIHDKTLMRKFFYDCKLLLAEGGHLVLQLSNYSVFNTKPMAKLPTQESIRVKLYTQLWTNEEGNCTLQQDLEHCGSKVVPVLKDVAVLPILPDQITEYAKEAGFKDINLYSGFDKSPLQADSPTVVCVLS